MVGNIFCKAVAQRGRFFCLFHAAFTNAEFHPDLRAGSRGADLPVAKGMFAAGLPVFPQLRIKIPIVRIDRPNGIKIKTKIHGLQLHLSLRKRYGAGTMVVGTDAGTGKIITICNGAV